MSTAARVARNTVANWTGLAANSLVILFLTPYVLHTLGNERFGVYMIAHEALMYVWLLVMGMRESVTRFTCQEIAVDNVVGLNEILSTVAALYLGVGALGMALCGVLGSLAPTFFDVDPAYASETSLLFWAMGAGFLITLYEQTFGTVLIGHQRYDLLNLGFILREVGRAGLTVLIFTLGWRTLGGFALAMVGAHLLAINWFWYAAHRRQRGLQVNPFRAKRRAVRRLLGFGVWSAMVQLGNTIIFATPALIVAKTLGADHVVFYAVPFLIADRIRVFVAGLANTLAPMAATSMATGDRSQFRILLLKGTRAAATLCFPIGAVMLVFCEPFLRLWMGPDYAWSWVVYAVLMVAMFGRISQAPTLWILIGGGQIRGLACVQLVAAVVMITLSVTLATCTSLGVIGVAVGFVVPLFLSPSVLLPWYAARQAGVAVGRYVLQSYLWPALSALSAVAAALLISRFWPPAGWTILIVEFAVSLSVAAVAAWHTCLDATVRQRVKKKLGIG